MLRMPIFTVNSYGKEVFRNLFSEKHAQIHLNSPFHRLLSKIDLFHKNNHKEILLYNKEINKQVLYKR